MGEILSRTKRITIYTASDGKEFKDEDALKDAKRHQTDLDFENILKSIIEPRIREVFKFNPVSAEDMEDSAEDKNFSEDDIGKAYEEEDGKINELVAIFENICDFSEFSKAIIELIQQYHEPLEKLISLFYAHRIGDHEIVKEK